MYYDVIAMVIKWDNFTTLYVVSHGQTFSLFVTGVEKKGLVTLP